MANENLKKMLELSKKVDAVANSNNSSHTRKSTSNDYITSANYDVKMAELNEQVFGKYEKPKGVYSAEDELERIKQRTNEGSSIQTSNPILQEVLNNPYSFDIDKLFEDSNPKMAQLEEKLRSKNYGSGLENAKAITKTLDEGDRQKTVERVNENTAQPSVTVDYSLIKTIVESVIEEKLSDIKYSLLNENVRHDNSKNLSMIMLGENFTFVDSEGNMYKCGDLKYVGKAKLKNTK